MQFTDGVGTIEAGEVADRIAVYRATELLGFATGAELDHNLVSVELTSGVTINPEATDSLTVAVSIRPDAAVDSFAIVIPDSLSLTVRDVASGLEVSAVTDREALATGSVFPLASAFLSVFAPSDSVVYCITDVLPTQVTAGMDSVALLSVSLTHVSTASAAPVHVASVAVVVVDSLGSPLNPGLLFDQTGYGCGQCAD